jgi:cytochrome b561
MSEAVRKYSMPAIILHWLTALLILALFVLGWYMAELPQKAPKATSLDLFDLGIWTMQFSEAISVRTFYFNLHKSLGVTLLALLVLRLVVRLREGAPAFPTTMRAWETRVAELTHKVLYALMVIVPLFGVGTTLYSKYGLKWFGLTVFEGLDDVGLRDFYRELHEIGGWLLFALIVLHVAAAVKHKVIDKDEVMSRMLP